MKASWILALVAATPMALALGQESPSDAKRKVLTFDCDCDWMLEVCHNMCYAIHCKHKPKQLTWDKPRPSIESKRGQINRCVPERENSRRGKFRATGFKNRKNCSFTVVFKGSETESIGPCKAKPDCENDDNQWTKRGPIKHEETQEPQTVSEYKLRRSGNTILTSEDLKPGDLVYHVVERNTTLAEEHHMGHVFNEFAGVEQYDYMSDNMDIEEDEILAKI
ncbi:hypothetical protein F5Y11DRAFT_360303 [Daldinia sp. FL1419]|nr:hypothetical protein F5Y11DRAFT_360303 [Daldinia sp. FL1419]